MREEYILQQIPERIKQLGYNKYHVRYRDFTILAGSQEVISAWNELWYIVDDAVGIIVDSNYGLYDSTGEYLKDNAHEHRGEIVIVNPDSESKRVKFIQVIIVN